MSDLNATPPDLTRRERDVLATLCRPALHGNVFEHEEYRGRLIAAVETDAEWYPDLYDGGWPNAPHRALRNSTAEAWEAADRPEPGSRPGEGQAIAARASGEPIVRYASALPLTGTTGDVAALSLWAGQSVALAKRTMSAAEIVAELVSRI